MVYFTRCWVQREPLWGAVRGVKPKSQCLFWWSERTQVTSDDRVILARKTALKKHRGVMGL